MASEVTQRQRAEALYGSLTCTTYREGYQDPDNDIGIIEQALTTARQEALREAGKVARDRALLWESHGGARMATPYDHLTVEGECGVIADELDRLAREGVK